MKWIFGMTCPFDFASNCSRILYMAVSLLYCLYLSDEAEIKIQNEFDIIQTRHFKILNDQKKSPSFSVV